MNMQVLGVGGYSLPTEDTSAFDPMEDTIILEFTGTEMCNLSTNTLFQYAHKNLLKKVFEKNIYGGQKAGEQFCQENQKEAKVCLHKCPDR